MSFLVFLSEVNLLLVPSLLVDELVMNSPVYWQNDDKFACGNVDCVASLPLCPSVGDSAVLSRWLLVITC